MNSRSTHRASIRALSALCLLAASAPALGQGGATPIPPARPQALPAMPPPGPRATPAQPTTGSATGERVTIEQVNSYLNGLTVLSGDFVQIGPNGRKVEGRVYVQKPGRIRFEYNPPSNLEVIADGRSVAVRDRRLATQDIYAIGQTPLKFLLQGNIDLRRDAVLKRIEQRPDAVTVRIEDKTTLGGSSQIALVLDPATLQLREWVVIDPQGFETTVRLANLDTTRRPDPKLFTINYERLLDTNR